MYRLSTSEFLSLISTRLKTPISEKDIFSSEIELSHLKRIDKIFEKGLHYYLDPKAPEASEEASIFFRKKNFAHEELNLGAKKIVTQFEDLKLSLSGIAKLSDIKFDRKALQYSIKQNPRTVANEIRKILYPTFDSNRRNFLKALISKFADNNILVFEFIENWNKKNKANIDGFFLKPNLIVLKRHQSFRREIFTLAHELGHYLLNEEEIEELDYRIIAEKNLTQIERWCNDFAYYFLVGEHVQTIGHLETATAENDYHFDTIEMVCNETHLSQIALFTRLLYESKITSKNYSKIRNDFEEKFKKYKEEKEAEKLRLKEQGKKQHGSTAKPIPSPLFISTLQAAFYDGILNEYEVCKQLRIKPEKLDSYIQ